MRKDLVTHRSDQLATISGGDISDLVSRVLTGTREELTSSPYIEEALRVLPVRGYRSAIGNIWNAVVDDLRNKILYRSVELFNKSVRVGRDVKTYEDFQTHVNDDELIDGAYKIGVIGFEASKVLKHAKETRHLFDGHPNSSEPTFIKVLGMFDDCVKYVLSQPYPAQIIDLEDYMKVVNSNSFDRNQYAIEIAVSELPEIYKNELANRLFTAYVHPGASSVLRSNIEFALPILWQVLAKQIQLQVVRRVDQEIAKNDAAVTEQAFRFVTFVDAASYLSPQARRYRVTPIVESLKNGFGTFAIENAAANALLPWAAVIPPEIVRDYVSTITRSYVGWIGHSAQYSRTNFYSEGAALLIPKMFEQFDDHAADAFVEFVKGDAHFKGLLSVYPAKLGRLRTLGSIVLSRVSSVFAHRSFLEVLIDPLGEGKLFPLLGWRARN